MCASECDISSVTLTGPLNNKVRCTGPRNNNYGSTRETTRYGGNRVAVLCHSGKVTGNAHTGVLVINISTISTKLNTCYVRDSLLNWQVLQGSLGDNLQKMKTAAEI